jgi:hypothetical protein
MTGLEITLLIILTVLVIVLGVVFTKRRKEYEALQKSQQELLEQLYFHQIAMNTYLQKLGITSTNMH